MLAVYVTERDVCAVAQAATFNVLSGVMGQVIINHARYKNHPAKQPSVRCTSSAGLTRFAIGHLSLAGLTGSAHANHVKVLRLQWI